jgi:hypothetical protein
MARIGAPLYINIIMAISNYELQQRQQLTETFKQFSDTYRSKMEFTGETIRKIDNLRVPLDPREPITYTETNEISIKMPQDEFEKFLKAYGQYMDLVYIARHNTMIREELHKILMLVELLK